MNWHIHEMLFGFVMGAVAGFLLTAIPNWTGRLPVRGAPLAVLVGLWLLGRIACLISAWLPAPVAVVFDLLFPAALAGVVAREIIAGRNWRNLATVAPVTLLAIAQALMDLEAIGVPMPEGLGWRLGLSAILVLISVVGGRITPSFTRNWLAKRGPVADGAFSRGWSDRVALAALHSGLFAWALFPTAHGVGWLLLAAAPANLWRMLRWKGAATISEPLLLILHVAYGWLALGAAVLGASILAPEVSLGAGVHTLTVGAAGTAILAVMTRATRGHTGRRLAADRVTSGIYLLVTAAAVARISAAFAGAQAQDILMLAAGLWIVAFILFAAAYSPMLLRTASS